MRDFRSFDGFPLMPHLSHRDGLKVDLAYYYREADGRPVFWTARPVRSATGPMRRRGRRGSTPCANATAEPALGLRRAAVAGDAPGRPERMRAMLAWLTTEGRTYGLRKILIEPHLKQRWAPGVDMVRFQGCRAARHDDHLHLELSK
jgi:hypothetical protein